MIKISVRDVTSKGLDIEQTIPKEGIGLSDEEIDLRSPIHVAAHLYKADNCIIAETDIETDFGFMCARCLQESHEIQQRDYQFSFELGPRVEYIDLGEEIRQELIVANPARILCKDDCKGICSKCGANLNLEECRCK